MTDTALKVYTAVIALVCFAAIAWSINQTTTANAWSAEAGNWQTTARQTTEHDRQLARQYRRLERRYNRLVVTTRRAQKKLISSMAAAQAAPTSVSGGIPASTSVAAPAPVPVATTTTAAPTTHTS